MKEDEWDYTPENSSSRNFSKSKTMLTAGISTNRYSDFENIMHQAACMLGAEKIVTGEEDPIGINVPKNIVRNKPTIRR